MTDPSYDVLGLIRDANPTRSHTCVNRRLLKVLEELGEASEAYLSKTSRLNYKKKTWDDFREESVDTLIVMLDVALTPLPWANWPPEALLHLHYSEGRMEPVKSLGELETLMIDIAASVVSAQRAISKTASATSFYGAIGRGVKAATKMCYAIIPGDNTRDIEKGVYNTVVSKIEKWKTGSSAPAAVEVLDAKTFMEHIEERELGNL